MKPIKKGLQKFTDTEGKINRLLSLDKITPSDLEILNESETDHFMDVITEKFNNLKGVARDDFYSKIEPITCRSTKNQLWESNHIQITWAISTLMQEYGRMPTKTEVANKTELSRQTIYKHLKEYVNHPLFVDQMIQFRYMTPKVLAKVFQFAVNGDIAAARLYFSIVGELKSYATDNKTVHNQNNFIQINGTVLTQDTVKQFTTDQLNTIENILKATLNCDRSITNPSCSN